ncbi:MAG: hypothetical protein NPINA01_27210 [Nitrospinaceae bacterium]|nr:MAG: hypothetical protein NPINA01_27210 [Nitrospinaceae bacterium]
MWIFEPDWQSDFKKWEESFRASIEGSEALKQLIDLDTHDDESWFKRLEFHVLKNCYLAQSYSREKDKAVQIREEHSAVLTTEKFSQIKAIKKLRDFIKDYPEISSAVFLNVHLSLKEKNISLATMNESSMPLNKLFDEILEEYSNGFSKPLLGLKAGNFMHRFSAGCLLYSEPLDLHSQRGDMPLNSLLYQLVDLFMQHTSIIISRSSWVIL